MATVHQYDKDGFYIGPAEDFGGPTPHGCFPEAPPETLPDGSPLPAYHRYRLAGGGFELIEDHRGRSGYRTDAGEEVKIAECGPWPENLATEPKPGRAYQWRDGQWRYDIRLDSPGPGYEFDEAAEGWRKTRYSVFTFLNLFTPAEKAALKKAIAEGDFEAAAIYDGFVTADYVDLRHPETRRAVRRLASEESGLLAENRVAEILRGDLVTPCG